MPVPPCSLFVCIGKPTALNLLWVPRLSVPPLPSAPPACRRGLAARAQMGRHPLPGHQGRERRLALFAPTTQNGSPACARPSPLHYPWSPQSSTASCTWSICRRGTVLAPMLSAPQSPRCLTRDLVTMRLGLHNECLELVATAQLLLWFRSTVQ